MSVSQWLHTKKDAVISHPSQINCAHWLWSIIYSVFAFITFAMAYSQPEGRMWCSLMCTTPLHLGKAAACNVLRSGNVSSATSKTWSTFCPRRFQSWPTWRTCCNQLRRQQPQAVAALMSPLWCSVLTFQAACVSAKRYIVCPDSVVDFSAVLIAYLLIYFKKR